MVSILIILYENSGPFTLPSLCYLIEKTIFSLLFLYFVHSEDGEYNAEMHEEGSQQQIQYCEFQMIITDTTIFLVLFFEKQKWKDDIEQKI